MRRAIVLALVGLLAGPLVPVQGQLKLTDDDRVLFFGAVPFWPASYSARVETFLRVKYPTLKTRFWHWSGPPKATVADARSVIGRHLQAFKPTLAVLNFGLRDGRLEPLQTARLERFRVDLLAIIDDCGRAGAKVVLVTPCYPEIDKKQNLQNAHYDQVVAAYAEAVRKIAQERDLDLVDWFEATSQHAQAMSAGQAPVEKLTIDGVTPAPLTSALGAEAFLGYLGAEPLTIELTLDWADDEATTSAGVVQALRRDDTTMHLAIKDIPVPWCVSGRGRRIESNRPGSDMCRYMLRIDNLPPGSAWIGRPGGRPKEYPQSALAQGIDWSFSKAVLGNKSAVDLLGRIKLKNVSADHFERMLRRPTVYPEFAQSKEMFLAALNAEVQAGAKVVDRTGRTLSLVLEIRHQADQSDPTSEQEP